ncbi:MAG: LysR family transcriptional regulator [Pseudomonadota bacterium]
MTTGLPPDKPRAVFDPGDLSFRGLQVFLAVEESGSMALAARQLSLSPATISQQITNMERLVGAKLFDRAARPIALTQAGTLMRRHARRIMEAVSEARTDLMELSLSANPQLRLAIIDDLDASVTPELVDHLDSMFPNCLFTATSGRSDLMSDRLARREADIAITGLPPEDPSTFDTYPLMREQVVLVAAKGALPEDGPIEAAVLSALPFVHYNSAMPLGRRITQHMKRLKLDIPQKYAFDASRAVFAMTRNLGGWALTTPLCYLDSERFWPDLMIRPVPFAGFSRTIYLAARRGEFGHLPGNLAGLARDLIDRRLVSRFDKVAPGLGETLTVLGSEAADRT